MCSNILGTSSGVWCGQATAIFFHRFRKNTHAAKFQSDNFETKLGPQGTNNTPTAINTTHTKRTLSALSSRMLRAFKKKQACTLPEEGHIESQ